MKRMIMFALITSMLIWFSSTFALVNTRLVFISNDYNTPSPGLGTLVLDVEAISTGSQEFIRVFQDAFQLDPVFRAQNPVVTFSNQRFPSSSYNVTEDYRSSDGRVNYVYTFDFGSAGSIETTYTKIVRVSIEYTMTSDTGTIDWFDGIPDYLVTNGQNDDITGIEEPSLMDISLPVELTNFEVTAGDHRVTLSWRTGSEINNAGFEVYRAFEKAGEYNLIASYENNETLEGAGNSNEQRNYIYHDLTVINDTTYWYKIADVSFSGRRTFHGPISASPSTEGDPLTTTTQIPTEFKLHHNFPNPFNPETTIRFDIPSTSQANEIIKLIVYNNLGMEVRTLYEGHVEPGVYQLQWDGRDDHGRPLSSGIYFVRLQSGFLDQIQKMLLVK